MYGADIFKVLLEGSTNRIEYQLNAIRKKYDISEDDQKVKYLQESANLISSLGSVVQREVYGGRVAEAAKISPDAMKLEIDRAWKRRRYQEKKKQEKIDLAPARSLQPRSRNIRYDNMKSAMAEETVIAMALKVPALLDQAGELKPDQFSVPLLAKVYGQITSRHEQGNEVSLAVLTDLDGEEMSHIAGMGCRLDGPVNEDAFRDCVRTIRAEHAAAQVSSEDDLLAYQNKLKERKGIKA